MNKRFRDSNGNSMRLIISLYHVNRPCKIIVECSLRIVWYNYNNIWSARSVVDKLDRALSIE